MAKTPLASQKKLKQVITQIEVMCIANGQPTPVKIFVGNPAEDKSPVHFQADFLAKSRGTTVPSDLVKFLEETRQQAQESKQNFAQLVREIIDTNKKQSEINSSANMESLPSSGEKNISDVSKNAADPAKMEPISEDIDAIER